MKIDKISLKKVYGLKVIQDGKMVSFESGLTFKQASNKLERILAVNDVLCSSNCINEYEISISRYAEIDTSNA